MDLDHQIDSQSIYGFDAVPQLRLRFLTPASTPQKSQECIKESKDDEIEMELMNAAQNKMRAQSLTSEPSSIDSFSLKPLTKIPKVKRWFEPGSNDTVNLGSSVKIFDEEPKKITTFPAGAARIHAEERRILDRIRMNEANNSLARMKSLRFVYGVTVKFGYNDPER